MVLLLPPTGAIALGVSELLGNEVELAGADLRLHAPVTSRRANKSTTENALSPEWFIMIVQNLPIKSQPLKSEPRAVATGCNHSIKDVGSTFSLKLGPGRYRSRF